MKTSRILSLFDPMLPYETVRVCLFQILMIMIMVMTMMTTTTMTMFTNIAMND